MEIAIREMLKKDILETSEVYIKAIKSEYKDFLPPEVLNSINIEREALELLKELNSNEKYKFTLVAVMNEEIVGFVSGASNTVEPYAFDSEIKEVFVKKEFQKLGIGLQLMYNASKKLRENGYTNVLIYSFRESKANSFYRFLIGKAIMEIEKDYFGNKFNIDLFGWELNILIATLENKLMPHKGITSQE